jgi:hypothetical protein
VFGGMLASTLLAIPFCTVFYIEAERLSEWTKRGRKQPDALVGGAAASAPQTGDSHPPLGG